MGLGKRSSNYDPALKYMGLGKKSYSYDPALKYMGLGKKSFNYDSKLKYMIRGKKSSRFDPTLRYMGLGKKNTNNNTDQKYMSDKKKRSNYDPALRYLGLGKRDYDPVLKYLDSDKKSYAYDHMVHHIDSNTKSSNYDPTLRYMGLKEKDPGFDPALKYGGFGKRKSIYDPALKYMGLGKKRSDYDPALKYMGLGKKRSNYDPALKYMGLGKKRSDYDPALKYMGLGKKSFKYDLKYVDLGKRSYDTDLNYMGFVERKNDNKKSEGNRYNLAVFSTDLKEKEHEKQSFSSDPSFKQVMVQNQIPLTVGLEKSIRNAGIAESTSDVSKHFKLKSPAEFFLGKPLDEYETIRKTKKQHIFDPALQLMGLGKRKVEALLSTDEAGPYEVYTHQKLTRETVNDLESLKQTQGNDVIPFQESNHSDVVVSGLTNKGMKQGELISKYLKRGKRNLLKKTELDGLSAESCGKPCRHSSRKKRDLNYAKLASEYGFKIESPNQFMNDPILEYLGISAYNDVITLNKNKRERDNRPKYNPGWIFIGLGKRSLNKKHLAFDKTDRREILQMDESVLSHYYSLMEKVKDRIQRMNSENWISFSNSFPYELKDISGDMNRSILGQAFSNPLNFWVGSNLYAWSSDPYWKFNIISTMENS
ncbi:uncharacterized protein NPIL_178051 [Nephila pilipes]|uniref:Uncharacterized protein n=1 Tax=Nephila pilipes TaxID=299642 RepID=A0A8X6Q1I9_NEPPI|nr:uncharacterized protein NPIL_178051 [Nephila pilipes]